MPVNQTIILIPKLDDLPSWDVIGFFISSPAPCLLLCDICGIVWDKLTRLRIFDLIQQKERRRDHPMFWETLYLKLNALVSNEYGVPVSRELIHLGDID